MILLNANNLKKIFLDRTLFEGVTFNVDSDDKIGFVGSNGAGKSTLFKILMNETEYDEGEIFSNKFTNIGYLEQYACSESENTIMQEMMTVFEEVISVEHSLDEGGKSRLSRAVFATDDVETLCEVKITLGKPAEALYMTF